jgi:hypothetical protein
MKLYHASSIENEESILDVGLFPTDCGSRAHTGESLQGRGLMGIYGFRSLDDCVRFVEDNCGVEYVIFEFDATDYDTIVDPEYFDGESLLVVTDEPISATKIDAE